MLNKRLLIRNLLAHNDENSFYDNKQRLDLNHKIGKAKFIKHICALSNANPANNSYIVVGIEDSTNAILGVDFFDDSKIQNLVNAHLLNPPKIQYENVSFPTLPKYKAIGLITIHATPQLTVFKKNAWKYKKGDAFYRRGSNSLLAPPNFELQNTNKKIVASIEKNASNNIELTLNGVFHFMDKHKAAYHPQYKVFNEQFVLCWAGQQKKIGKETFYSRVDIELVNEQVRLFYSDLDDVKIEFDNNSFRITEFVQLGINDIIKLYPLEKKVIHFKGNGRYVIASEVLFEAPQFDLKNLHHVYNTYNTLLHKLESHTILSQQDIKMLEKAPIIFMICILHEFENAKERLDTLKPYLKALDNKKAYIKYKEVKRILRKLKYR